MWCQYEINIAETQKICHNFSHKIYCRTSNQKRKKKFPSIIFGIADPFFQARRSLKLGHFTRALEEVEVSFKRKFHHLSFSNYALVVIYVTAVKGGCENIVKCQAGGRMVTTMSDSGVNPLSGRSLGEMEEMVRGKCLTNLWIWKLWSFILQHRCQCYVLAVWLPLVATR